MHGAFTKRHKAEFDRKLDRIVGTSFAKQPPGVLFHYTSWTGFCGIVSTQRFWATAHHCTNDPAELVSADAIVNEIARALLVQTSVHGRKPLLRFLEGFASTKISRKMVTYLACFSEARDKSCQWIKYAEEGRGVCLGVRVLDEKFVEDHGQNVGRGTYQVEYSEESWRRRVEENFLAIMNEFQGYAARFPYDRDRVEGLCWSALSRVAAYAGICAKQAKWSKEQEWRHVAIARKGYVLKPDTRRTDEGLVEYVKLRMRGPGDRIAFQEVMLGPESDRDVPAVRSVLQDAGYGSDMPQLTRSTCPLKANEEE